jgi:hypothetical protein
MLNKIIDDEPLSVCVSVCVPVCVCAHACVRVCVYVCMCYIYIYIYTYILRVLIMKDKIWPFSNYNYNMRIYNFLQKFVAHMKSCGSTPVAEH